MVYVGYCFLFLLCTVAVRKAQAIKCTAQPYGDARLIINKSRSSLREDGISLGKTKIELLKTVVPYFITCFGT